MGGESSVLRRTLSSRVFPRLEKLWSRHDSGYFRRFRRGTGSDFLSAPRLRGRDPRRDAAALAETSHSRPIFLQSIAPARQSRAMWVGVQPASSAASIVVTMSFMSIVATPHLRRQTISRLRTIPFRPMYQRRGRDSNLYARQLNRREVQSSLHHRPAQETEGRTRSLLTDAQGCEGV